MVLQVTHLRGTSDEDLYLYSEGFCFFVHAQIHLFVNR